MLKRKSISIFLSLLLIFLTSGCAKKEGKESYRLPRLPWTLKEKISQLTFCPLCGEEVEKFYANRRPLAIIMENHPRSRPQTGLDKACIVYEALVEGEITRFLALYLCKDALIVGPIRSARPYLIDLSLEYSPVLVHCGQSWEAFDRIEELNFPTINQMWRPKAFWRIKKRKAPHNLYTSTPRLREVIKDKGWEKPPRVSRFLFEEEPSLSPKIPLTPAKEVRIIYPGGYKVTYQYEPEKKSYLRFMAGKPHLDFRTGRQLRAKNIIIQYALTSVIDREGRLKLEIEGKGEAKIIWGGKAFSGRWYKKDPYTSTSFFDSEDNLIKLLPGQTWIQIVPPAAKIEISS